VCSDILSHCQVISHGLSLSTIINSLTWALQNVNKRKDIQCCQLKPFQYSKTNSVFQFLNVSIIYQYNTVTIKIIEHKIKM
jgi:hypothetical protein